MVKDELVDNQYGPDGFDKNGLDKNGFDKDGIHIITQTVFNPAGLDKNGFDKDGIKKEVEPETLEPETEAMTLTNDDYESPYHKGNSEPPDTFVIPPPDDDDGLPTPD